MSDKDNKKDGKRFRLRDLDRDQKVDRDEYEIALAERQRRLQRIQQAYLNTGDRAVIVFEGWDAAGKGGTIRRMSWVMDPRSLKVWPISAPNPEDQAKHFLYRFWMKLPAPREIAVFDRSWYGRVLVERVEGYASKDEWKRGYGEIRDFERTLVDSGARIVKIFLDIAPETQLERFASRMENPVKRWKLTLEDFRNRDNWQAYTDAIEEMIDRTSTEEAPWTVIPSDNKKWARLQALGQINKVLSAGVDLSPSKPGKSLIDLARRELGDDFVDGLDL